VKRGKEFKDRQNDCTDRRLWPKRIHEKEMIVKQGGGPNIETR